MLLAPDRRGKRRTASQSEKSYGESLVELGCDRITGQGWRALIMGM
jgi:hypothetical protein